MKYVLLLFLALFAMAADGAASDGMLDISTLNAQRAQYDGQQLTLFGYLVIGPESMYLVKRLGYDKDYWAKDSGCLSLLNTGDLSDKEDTYNGKFVEIKGLFRANNYSYGISFSECGLTGIDIDGSPSKHIKILKRGGQ
ncbi:hypothetical protein [Rhodanobacter spathiphylli]|uniref:hypothetical protein n=1 Tax=Rhodanobacter spathiphylli TaxID=347483 RepID=UPI0012FBD0C0|nr:hypothetical protein [Rhodanobacter spathiphylli]